LQWSPVGSIGVEPWHASLSLRLTMKYEQNKIGRRNVRTPAVQRANVHREAAPQSIAVCVGMSL
jgi:hypothetical protein